MVNPMIKNIQQPAMCFAEETFAAVMDKLSQKNVKQVYVINKDQQLLGMVTKDTIIAALKRTPEKTQQSLAAKDILKKTFFVDLNDKPETAMEMMMQHYTTECPVVDRGTFLGYVTYREILYQMIEEKDK